MNLLRAILAILIAGLLSAQNVVTLSGRITDAANGLPIEGAAVDLIQSGAGGFRQMRFTDAGGNYSFDAVPTGAASVTIGASGFLAFEKTNPDEASIQIVAGYTARDFSLTPVASIIGRITAEDGSRLGNGIYAWLYREDFTDGVRHFSAAGAREGVVSPNTATIAADGAFKVSELAPGRYILCAGPPMGLSTAFIMASIGGNLHATEQQPEGYVQTYYPGTTDFSAAIPISVRAGETVTADLKVAKKRLFRASGEFAIPDTKEWRQATVQISSAGDGLAIHRYGATASASGKFAIEGLPPGEYLMDLIRSLAQTQPSVSGISMSFAAIPLDLPFTITDHDVDDLRPVAVPPKPSLSIDGTFRMANGVNGNAALPANLSVQFAYPQPGGESTAIAAAPNGVFWLSGMPGVYSVRPVVPTAYAVTEIRYAGGNYLNSLIPFNGGAADQSLAIMLSDQPGAVAGTLIDGEQKPVAAKVALAPEPLPADFDFRAIRVASTDKLGVFVFSGIPQGRYKAVVLTGDDRKRDHDLAILAGRLAVADSFEVAAGQSLTIALQP